MNPYQLAVQLISGRISELTFDAHMVQLFPDFVGFYSSENVDKALEFIQRYLPECKAIIDFNKKEVKIVREEPIPGAGLYQHTISQASFAGKPAPAQAIMAAGLFAYHYLFS